MVVLVVRACAPARSGTDYAANERETVQFWSTWRAGNHFDALAATVVDPSPKKHHRVDEIDCVYVLFIILVIAVYETDYHK